MSVNLTQGYYLQDTDLNTFFYSSNLPYSPVYARYEYGYVDPIKGYKRIGPINRIPLELNVGRFRPNFILDERAQIGTYKITWRFKVSENSSTIEERTEYFYIITEGLYDHFILVSSLERLHVIFYTVTLEDMINKYLTISDYLGNVAMNVVNGTAVQLGVDYIFSGHQISWDGLRLDGEINVGDTLRIIYTVG